MSEIKLMNFRKIEITAASKKEAFEKIEKEYFTVKGNATRTYGNWLKSQTGEVTDRDKKMFMLDYLEKTSKSAAGIGFVICLQSPVADTRERPYTISNVRNEEGKRRAKKALVWVDDETGTPIARVFGTKSEASKVLKELYKTGKYKGNAHCEIHYDIVEGNPVVMKAKYTPSKKTQDGVWIAFGFERV